MKTFLRIAICFLILFGAGRLVAGSASLRQYLVPEQSFSGPMSETEALLMVGMALLFFTIRHDG